MAASTHLTADAAARRVISVRGSIPLAELDVTDAHNHIWIEPVAGAAPDSPVLNRFERIKSELEDFRLVGGCAVLDCQPGGCGRNANRLAELSSASGVAIICATGFHRRRYYAPNHWLWDADADQAAAYFTGELRDGAQETLAMPQQVRAGFIKVACEASLTDTPLAALQGAAQAAAASGAAVQIHTEKGASAEAIFDFMIRHGVAARQVVLCHMDKRPDFGLHRELVQAGALLEYDTFYRPKYEPERNLWPLIEKMASAGLHDGVALATDIAEAALWAHLGGGPGLAGFVSIIRPRLEAAGLPAEIVCRLLGGSINERLAQ